MRKKAAFLLAAGIVLLSGGCGSINSTDTTGTERISIDTVQKPEEEADSVTEGTREYRGFILDNVLHSAEYGDIHYNLYIPDSYDGSKPYAVFLTLPGYEGLYFQGVGETMSQVLGMRPDLFTAYLHCSSQWDGAYQPVAESRTPVYLVVGEHDEYYGAEPSIEAYENLHSLYRQAGLTEEEISDLLVLDIKSTDYFESKGVTVQHGGGSLFSEDKEVMGWLFDR